MKTEIQPFIQVINTLDILALTSYALDNTSHIVLVNDDGDLTLDFKDISDILDFKAAIVKACNSLVGEKLMLATESV